MGPKDAGKFVLGAIVVVAVGQAARALPRSAGQEVVADRLVSRSLDSSSEIEPHLAALPTGQMTVAWMALRGGKDGAESTHLGVRSSADRGQTWGDLVELKSPDGRLAMDPTVAYFKGAPRVTWLAPGKGDSLILTSTLGGSPVLVSSEPGAVERPVSASGGDRLWVAYASAAGKGVIVVASTEDGAVFAKTTAGEGGSRPTICASGKNVALAWLDANHGVMVAASQDSAKTFTRYLISGASERVGDETPSCVLDGEDLWIAYGAHDSAQPDAGAPSALDYAVVVASHDAGRSTHDRSSVRPGAKILHPVLSLRGSGALDLAYLTGGVEGDKAGRAGAHRVVASGAAKLPRTIKEPLVFTGSETDPAWAGDYFGVATSDKVTLAALVRTEVVTTDAGGSGVERHVVIAPIPEE